MKEHAAIFVRETDDELCLACEVGTNRPLSALYRRRQAAIYRFALHMSGSASLAEDITQEVFLALLREECGYDPERGTLSGIFSASPASWCCGTWSAGGRMCRWKRRADESLRRNWR